MAGDEVFGVATMVLQWGIVYPEGKVPFAQEKIKILNMYIH